MEKAVLLSFIFYGNLTLKQKIKIKSGFLFYYYTYPKLQASASEIMGVSNVIL